MLIWSIQIQIAMGNLDFFPLTYTEFIDQITRTDLTLNSICMRTIRYKPEGITYPSSAMQEKLMSEFYQNLRLDPRDVVYVEAHGTGNYL